MKQAVIAVLCVLAFASGGTNATAASSPAPAATAPANADVLARAKAVFASLQAGTIDRTQLTDVMNKSLSDDQLKTVAAKIGPLGAPTSFDQIATGSQSGSAVYTYRLGFSNGDHLNFLFAVDGSDKISGFYLLPPQ